MGIFNPGGLKVPIFNPDILLSFEVNF